MIASSKAPWMALLMLLSTPLARAIHVSLAPEQNASRTEEKETCANYTFESSTADVSGNGEVAFSEDSSNWDPVYAAGKVGQAVNLNAGSGLYAGNWAGYLKGPVMDTIWVDDQYFEISFWLALDDQKYQQGEAILSFKDGSEEATADWLPLLWKSSGTATQATLDFGKNGETVLQDLSTGIFDGAWHYVKLWTTDACSTTTTWQMEFDSTTFTKTGVGSICGRQLFLNRHCWGAGGLCSSRVEMRVDELVIRADSCAPPTPAPTMSGVPPPSPPPTPAPIVSGTADPHLVNLRGEHFDIYQPGSFVLVQLPRSAEPTSTLLLVEAGARNMGGPCAVYFQVVTISGAWTNQTEPLLFTADPHGKPSGTSHSVQWMYFGPVGVKVIHWRKEVDFLDIYVKNVGATGHTVGGLLGSDDHKELAPRPRQCSLSHGRAASRVSSFAEARS